MNRRLRAILGSRLLVAFVVVGSIAAFTVVYASEHQQSARTAP